MYVNTMNLTVSLTLMMFRLHAQFQVNSEGSLQLSVVHSLSLAQHAVVKRKNVSTLMSQTPSTCQNAPGSLQLRFSYTGSKVIRYVARGGGRAWERG